MQKVIALDIGSYSIKAIEILNTFKSYEITNFYEKIIPTSPTGNSEEATLQSMELIFKENNLDADRIVTALPGQLVSSRILTFNFSDQRKIAKAVISNLEEVVPFNLDDMVIDHHIMGSFGKKTMVLVVMTKKSFLSNFLDLLHKVDIDPRLIDIDSLAFYNLTPFIQHPQDSCYATIDVGHEKTSICVFKDGVLRMFRSINLGGKYITEFLAKDMEVSFDEAQALKHRVSKVLYSGDNGEDLSSEDRFVSERIGEATSTIIKELGRTTYSFKNWDRSPLSQIYLSGGTSLIKNFKELLEEQLEISVDTFTLQGADLQINPSLNQYISLIPQGIGIGLRTVSAVKKQSTINLRRGEFAYVQNYESLIKNSMYVAKIVGVIFLMLFVCYGLKYFIYSKNIHDMKDKYIKGSSAILTGKKNTKPGKVDFKKLVKTTEQDIKKEIDKMKNTVDYFYAETDTSPVIEILKEASKVIPKTLVVEFTEFAFRTEDSGNRVVTIKAETEGYENEAKVLDLLKSIPFLSNVTEVNASSKIGQKNANIIVFTVRADYISKNDKELLGGSSSKPKTTTK